MRMLGKENSNSRAVELTGSTFHDSYTEQGVYERQLNTITEAWKIYKDALYNEIQD